MKAAYVEYLDPSFTIKRQRTRDEKHLGFLGPVIKGEVGDVFEIVLRNKATRPYSIYPNGVNFDKGEEGFIYRNSRRCK